jgi:transcriptional regulator with XRE-family HTH domain
VKKLKKDLMEIREIDEKVKSKLNYLKSNAEVTINNTNEIKALKNHIYERTSKTFVYNLKKLIQLEGTQKKLAKKIGVSEDLLSKYKSGETFPSIETLLYICEVYNITLEKLITVTLITGDIENIENVEETEFDIFEEKYYVYFLVTNIAREGAIHEGVVEFSNDDVIFKILSKGKEVKAFKGHYDISDKLIFFNLQSQKDGIAYINMIKPNVNKYKYVGGLAMLMLPSDANSKPCAQKLLFSKIRLDRELYYNNLKELLTYVAGGETFGHIKISQWEDEVAYNFIGKLL